MTKLALTKYDVGEPIEGLTSSSSTMRQGRTSAEGFKPSSWRLEIVVLPSKTSVNTEFPIHVTATSNPENGLYETATVCSNTPYIAVLTRYWPDERKEAISFTGEDHVKFEHLSPQMHRGLANPSATSLKLPSTTDSETVLSLFRLSHSLFNVPLSSYSISWTPDKLDFCDREIESSSGQQPSSVRDCTVLSYGREMTLRQFNEMINESIGSEAPTRDIVDQISQIRMDMSRQYLSEDEGYSVSIPKGSRSKVSRLWRNLTGQKGTRPYEPIDVYVNQSIVLTPDQKHGRVEICPIMEKHEVRS